MIFYVVTGPHLYTITGFLETYGRHLASRVKVVFYEQLTGMRHFPAGTYIFSDIERLSPAMTEVAAQVWNTLSAAGDHIRLLNHPTQAMRRYELLRMLYEEGSNRFNIYRLTEHREPEHFPVFIRGENDHAGSLTPLLHTKAELDAAISNLGRRGCTRDNKVIIEFCNTADTSGTFRKYAAFIIGERIIPDHLFFSQQWMAKNEVVTQIPKAQLREEWEYVQGNPHAAALREIARRARIEYGRFDYGVLNGTLQVWELNTNPMLPLMGHSRVPERAPFQAYTAREVHAAFEVLDNSDSPRLRVPSSVRQSHVRRVGDVLFYMLPPSYTPYVKWKLWKLKNWLRVIGAHGRGNNH